MKILLIHGDIVPWATYNRAMELKKRWVDDDVTITDYNNLPDGRYFDIIHILFSGTIGKLKEYILKNKGKVYATLASQRTLDFVYDDAETLKTVYKNCIKTVAQNPKLATGLKRLIGKKYEKSVVYIPNGVDTALFKSSFRAGFVGNDQHQAQLHKGYYLAKQACEELGVEFVYCRNNYPHDLIPHKKMPAFYNKIDCLIIPSESEGCNNPTLEALAMNIPVISTDCGIAAQLEGVILVDRTIESIKEALRLVCPRIGVLEKYTWDIVAKQYHDLYVQKQGD